MEGITERTEDPTFRERVEDLVCRFQPQLLFLFVVDCVLLVLALFSLAYIDASASGYPILQIDLVIIGVTLLITGGSLYHCNQRDRNW